MIAIYTLTSALHDEEAVARMTQQFLNSLNIDYAFKGTNYDSYGTADLDLLYVRTGGSESKFLEALPTLRALSRRPIYLLTNGKSNSLAASMEILSYMNSHGIEGEILHGSTDYINRRVTALVAIEAAFKQLKDLRLGIVGAPSDWLISSVTNADTVKQRLGIDLVKISLDEVLRRFNAITDVEVPEALAARATTPHLQSAVADAQRLYLAMRGLCDEYQLSGFTVRCFDLLSQVHNTGCWALARLNAEGITAGCEGDVPTLLAMTLTRVVTGVSGFQCNPANIDPERGEITFAHCTIPLNMVERYELDTHFESGIGVGIRGFAANGPVTIFKVSGDLSRFFVAEGTLVRSEAKPDLCRTQQVIELDNAADARYFLTAPIGNHHVVMPGHHAAALRSLLK